MKRIFHDFAYSNGPRSDCYWDTTCDLPTVSNLTESLQVDVAVIGAGFTGLNAALHLAQRGVSVAVLEAKEPGWGASGRNGGFCCLGGGKIEDVSLDARFGKAGRLEWRAAERLAVAHVESFLEKTGADVDRHSNGETWLAHRAKDMVGVDEAARAVEENYGVTPRILHKDDLVDAGMKSDFHGALDVPVGFALNPRKYLAALLRETLTNGATIVQHAPVKKIERSDLAWVLHCGPHKVRATQVLIATNGYSSEDVPKWMAGRYMPTQSIVGVTRPMSDAEQATQGWTSNQMSYDSRNLLHYFRLMPNGRMLFGLRAGLRGTPDEFEASKSRLLQHFQKMFPAWRDVPFTHFWSGLVCLSRNRLPVVGEIPNHPGMWCAFAFHGNGVAMGSYAGTLTADALLTGSNKNIPEAMKQPARAFPFGMQRKWLMSPLYAGLWLQDL